MFNELRWEVVVCFVDIGGIVVHISLNFLFIIHGRDGMHIKQMDNFIMCFINKCIIIKFSSCNRFYKYNHQSLKTNKYKNVLN
jgi:hypothetical protein